MTTSLFQTFENGATANVFNFSLHKNVTGVNRVSTLMPEFSVGFTTCKQVCRCVVIKFHSPSPDRNLIIWYG